MRQKKFFPMSLKRSTNAASAEKKLILPPVPMKLVNPSRHFLPGAYSWQKMDHSGFNPILYSLEDKKMKLI